MRVQLPWGHWIRIDPKETVGSCIARQGVYDIRGCEAIWRLLEKGESALDVGANVGQMTSLMAEKVGAKGRVYSFEPHPDIFLALNENISEWSKLPSSGEMMASQMALSDKVGTSKLYMPPKFRGNNGVASLENEEPSKSTSHDVKVSTLDAVFSNEEVFGLMKMDIEGHELTALNGGARLLSSRRVRDIVFEEHRCFPTPVTSQLMEFGYKIYYIDSILRKPKIIPVESRYSVNQFDAPNYLATLDPARAEKIFQSSGWHCIR